MAIAGINTGSGYSGYTGGSGIGALGRETINRTSGNAEFGRQNVVESEKSVVIERKPLENQVAVSTDGDTLQLSPKAVAKLDAAIKEIKVKDDSDNTGTEVTGNVADEAEVKAEAAENARKEARLKAARRTEILKEAVKNEQKKVVHTEEKQAVSFTGKSDSDITRLYLEGEITKSDYDSEMSSRQKLRAQAEKKDNDFVNISTEGNSKAKRVERFGNNLKAAFSESASKTFDAVTRLDTIDAAEGAGKTEQKNTKSERREIKISFR